MLKSRRRLIVIGIGVLLFGAILYHARHLLGHAELSGGELLRAIRGARLSLLMASLAAIYVCYVLRALRWMSFSRHLGPVSFWNIYSMTLAGFSVLFLLGRAADPIRPLLLARKEKQPVADTMGIYALERLFDTASTAVIAAIGLFLLPTHAGGEGVPNELERAARTAGTILFAGVFTVAAALVYLRLHGTSLLERRLEGWSATPGWRSVVARIVLGFVRGIQTIRSWGDLGAAVFYSAAHWGLIVVIYFWVTRSFGGRLGEISFSGAALVMAFTMVGSTVQLPAVGGGSQVGSIVAYTAIFGVQREPAVAAAIVLWLITFAACSVAGVPLLIREGLSLGELRKMAVRKEK